MIKGKNTVGKKSTHKDDRFLKNGEFEFNHVSDQFSIHFNEARKGGIL